MIQAPFAISLSSERPRARDSGEARPPNRRHQVTNQYFNEAKNEFGDQLAEGGPEAADQDNCY